MTAPILVVAAAVVAVAGIAPDANCPNVSVTTSHTTPSVQLLIHRSLSMNYKLDTALNISRYQAISGAVQQVVGQLQNKVYFGASLYTQEGTVCPNISKTATRSLGNAASIKALIEGSSPAGYTPTAAAFVATAALFDASPPPAGSPPIIVLATDGFPNNCQTVGDPQADTIAAVAAAHGKGIRTFVLGIAGVGDTFLQQVANAGQGMTSGDKNAAYYTANTVQELNAAMQTIVGDVASCELSINGSVDPQHADSGTVTLDGAPLKHGVDWTLADPSTLRLVGAACTTLKTSTNAHVEASFPCTAVVLL